jgi:hypothetical protein
MRRLQPPLLSGPTVRLLLTPRHFTFNPQTATLSAARQSRDAPRDPSTDTPALLNLRSTSHLRSPAIAQPLTTLTAPFPTSHIPHPTSHIPTSIPTQYRSGAHHSRTASNPHKYLVVDYSRVLISYQPCRLCAVCGVSRAVGLGLRRAYVLGRKEGGGAFLL